MSFEHIPDLDGYNHRMALGMEDKLWFLGHTPPSDRVIVDYGCADGVLLDHIYNNEHPHKGYLLLIGYDSAPEMIAAAKARNKHIFFTTEGDKVTQLKTLAAPRPPVTVLLSSVLHEVYHYWPGYRTLWETITRLADNIAIRDMMFIAEDTPVPAEDYAKLRARKESAASLASFEAIYGPADHLRNFTHFLMKYRYTDNWERELPENYFSVDQKELISTLIAGKQGPAFKLEYLENYTLPYIKETVLADFGIEMTATTHVKMMFRRA